MINTIYPNLMRRISEKTIEINLLRYLANCIERKSSQTSVKIISPTQNQEKDLGFDAVLSATNNSRIIAIQFKKPKLDSKVNNIKFKIDVEQQNIFTNHRPSVPCKFYILAPFTSHDEFITKESDQLLNESRIIYIHDMPNTDSISTKSYTMRIINNAVCHKMDIIDSNPLEFLCSFMSEEETHKCLNNFQKHYDDKIKKQKIGKIYYLKLITKND